MVSGPYLKFVGCWLTSQLGRWLSLRAHSHLAVQMSDMAISLNTAKIEVAKLEEKNLGLLALFSMWDTEKSLGQREKRLSVAQGYLCL